MSNKNGNVDEKRDSFFECPYCGENYPIRLKSNEDVSSRKKD